MDKLAELSLTEKVKLLSKILLLAQVAESYSENKKVLSYLKKTALEESKLLDKSKYSLTEEDGKSASKLIAEFVSVLTDLSKAKTVDDWRPASKALDVYIEKLTAQLLSDEKLLLPPTPEEPDIVTKVLNSAASGVRKLGSMIDKGVEQIKKQIKENLKDDEE